MPLRSYRQTLSTQLDTFRVCLLTGPRQCGKSTLVRQLASERRATYVTLDDADALRHANQNPAEWLSRFPRPLFIDEVQKAPNLLQAIKIFVDLDDRRGQFLLTGSSDVLLSPRVSESLAGRMFVGSLWPMTQGELDGHRTSVVDALFGEAPLPQTPAPVSDGELIERIVRSGYPEPAILIPAPRRRDWFESHLVTVLSRDVGDLGQVGRPGALLQLMSAAAGASTGRMNLVQLAANCGLDQITARRYLALLEGVFLVRTLPAWAHSVAKRLARRPKLLLTDSGLHAHLVGASVASLATDRTTLGALFESFVVNELLRESTWGDLRPYVSHFRTHAGEEVNLVLEAPDGRVVGVEVKLSASPGGGDLRGLRALRDAAGKKFVRGVVVCTAPERKFVDGSLEIMPVAKLWQTG